MHISYILTTALAALAAAAPTTEKRAKKYHGISLIVDLNPAGEPETASPGPIEIGKLTGFGHTHASKLTFDPHIHFHVDIDKVTCRAYKDKAGTEPLGGPFTVDKPLILSTTDKLPAVGSVLCYVTQK